MSLLGASVAILLLIHTIGANVIPLQKLRINSERYSESPVARAAGDEYRLPQPLIVIPDTYTITLTPDYTYWDTFIGEVQIEVTSKKAVNKISLHYDQMTISQQSVTKKGVAGELGATYDEKNYDNKTNIYAITLLKGKTLQMNQKYIIYFKYTGHLLEDKAGFYRSSYETANGDKR
jgi:aminopeptidase 2